MIKKVLKFIKKYNLCSKTVVVGFSGGFDSMALLHILIQLRKETEIRLVAAHYNHNWRGVKALEEQERCREFCNKFEIDFYTETADIDVKKNETVARNLRYDFFYRVANKYSTDIVFTAHNFDDNAETVLYRIIKGTGVKGLGGINVVRDIFYRPLLDITRDEIEKYCKDNNLSPNNDDSNKDIIHKRNLIRHEIMPMLSKINPDVKKALNSLSVVAKSEEMIIDEYIESLDLFDNGIILTNKYKVLSDVLKKKIIHKFIYNVVDDYDKVKIDEIYYFLECGIKNNKPVKMSLTSDKWLYIDKNIIEIVSEKELNDNVIKIDKCGEYEFEDNIFTIELCENIEKTFNENTAYVNLTGYDDLCIRTRKDGDIIYPLGLGGKMKLKKYFIEKDVPQHKRSDIILLCSGNEVLWVLGIGLSDKIKVKDKPTHRISINNKR